MDCAYKGFQKQGGSLCPSLGEVPLDSLFLSEDSPELELVGVFAARTIDSSRASEDSWQSFWGACVKYSWKILRL